MTWMTGGSRRFGGSSGPPTARWFQPVPRNPARGARPADALYVLRSGGWAPVRCSHGAEQVRAQAGDAEGARAGVGGGHRADLADELRLPAVDLAPALDQAPGLGRRLDVLDG